MNKSNNIAIRLINVTKQYTRYPGGYRLVSRIHHEKPTLVERLTNGRDEEFWVYPGKCEACIPGAGKT